ncbi:TolC family protein [Dendrosporobacter sp. 1207_IL3150]|uniref:TolC family protein n=1 Tax=Dendrosporobacter sp. 1207_IL3150 TaxID=3084054 RepID=UPI002FD8831A
MKKHYKRYLSIFSVVSILAANTTVVTANTVQSLNLQEAITAAVSKNPSVIEMQKQWEVKEKSIPIAKAQPNPELGIMKDDIPTSTLDPLKGMMTEFTISQEIMNPSKVNLMGKMAANEAAMAKQTYNDKRIELYSEAKKAYYDVLYATKALEVEKENQQLMGQLTQIAQVNYSTGMVSLQDSLKAQTEFSKMTTDLVDMAAMLAVTKAKLNVLMARATDTPFTAQEEFNSPPPNFNLASLQKTASETRPALIGMKSQVEMAQNGINLAKKEQLPDFELQLGYKTYKQEEMMPVKPDNWKVGFMVMLPIWQDKNSAQIKSASAGLEAAQASLNNMENMTSLDVQMALTEAQSSWRQVELFKSTVIPQAEQTYQAGVVGYTNGKVDFMAVLDSLNALRNAKLGYYKAKVDYEKAIANLEKAIGKPLVGSL